MDYFSEIVEDDSTLVLNNYDNYEDIFEDDSLDSRANDAILMNSYEKAETKQGADKMTKILGDLHDAEEIVTKLLSRKGRF